MVDLARMAFAARLNSGALFRRYDGMDHENERQRWRGLLPTGAVSRNEIESALLVTKFACNVGATASTLTSL